MTIQILQNIVHYSLHFVAPGIIAFIFFRAIWKKAWMIMVLTMAVDADHLLADPIFDPNRCSIGFHYLHSYYAISSYLLVFVFVKNTTVRIIAFGLLLHMFSDYQDCLW